LPLAQALHGYYSSHSRPYPVKLETLRQFTGRQNVTPRSFKQHIKRALDELVKVGFLESCRVDEAGLVTVWRKT
jgi:hypothetical protein